MDLMNSDTLMKLMNVVNGMNLVEKDTHLNEIIEFNERDDCNEYTEFNYFFKWGGKEVC